VPVGAQTATADAYAGAVKVGTGSTPVTVSKGQTAQVSITVLDGSGPDPLPDHSPVITSFVVPASTVSAGSQTPLSATALDADGDALTWAWTASPSGCGTFTAPAAPSTTFTAGPAGTCTLQVAATARSKTDTRSASVSIVGALPPSFPVSVHSSGRYLVDAAGEPVRLHGDSPWSLISNLTSSEVDTYLADRQAKSFNALIVNLLEHKFAINAPADRAGDFPFTSHTAGAYDFSTPNEAYFAFADTVIDKAAAAGMLVFLDVMYAGYNGGDEGWWTELNNSKNTQSVCLGYGQYVGNRYKAKANVVWMISGDFTPPAGSEGEARLLKILQGLRAAGATQIATAHIGSPSITTDWTAFAPSASIVGVYPSSSVSGVYTLARRGWQGTPARPVFLIEPGYEDEGWEPGDPASIRMYEWWAQLTAIGGVFYGQRDIWPFQNGTWGSGFPFGNQPWQQSLSRPAAVAMSLMASLLSGLSWFKLVPSGQSGLKTLVTAGGGTDGGLDFVTAAADPAGSLLLAYVPSTGTGTRGITIDLTALAGTLRASWWNPTTGATTSIATGIANTGTRQFTTPGDNGSGANDWLLMLQSP
jgi:hypothetical protein